MGAITGGSGDTSRGEPKGPEGSVRARRVTRFSHWRQLFPCDFDDIIFDTHQLEVRLNVDVDNEKSAVDVKLAPRRIPGAHWMRHASQQRTDAKIDTFTLCALSFKSTRGHYVVHTALSLEASRWLHIEFLCGMRFAVCVLCQEFFVLPQIFFRASTLPQTHNTENFSISYKFCTFMQNVNKAGHVMRPLTLLPS